MSRDWDWPGGRWWRCDFHVHTPKSHDFFEQSATAEEWVDAAIQAGLDAVAITDHDAPGFIEEARAAAGDRLSVFAGVELTSSEGIHLLALFGPDVGEAAVSALLGVCGVPADKWGKGDARADKTLLQCLDAAGAEPHRALCLLAHADAEVTERNPSRASLLRSGLDGTTRRRVLEHPHLMGVEIRGSDSAEHRTLRAVDLPGRREPGLALVAFSDAHRLAEIGSRSTWIKMTRPTLEGLRLALCDGDRSVRIDRPGVSVDDWPENAVESISITDALYVGRSGPLELRFNPGLTTLIGGRGSGKSSVIRLMRAALDQTNAPAVTKADLDAFLQVGARGEDGALTDNTVIHVVYRKAGARFRSTWTTDRGTALLEEERDGEWTPAEGSTAGRLPITILGQGEIHETARKPQALLRIVDQAPEIAKTEWQRRFDEESTRYLALQAQVRQAEASLASEPEIRGQLADLVRTLAMFEEAQQETPLRRFEQASRQQAEVGRVTDAGSRSASVLRQAVDAMVRPELEADLFAHESGVHVTDAMASLRQEIEQAADAVTSLAQRVEDATRTFRRQVEGSPWAAEVAQAQREYGLLVDQLRASGVSEPGQYGELIQRRETLEQEIADLAARREQTDAVRAEAADSMDALRRARTELSNVRDAFLTELLDGNAHVKIDLVALSDFSDLVASIREQLGIEVGFDQDINELANLVRDATDPFVGLEAMKRRVRTLADGDTSVPLADQRFATRMQRVDSAAVDRLDTWFPEDRLEPSYSRGDGKFQSLRRGSAGQQNAAVLAFLLSRGAEPICIDQPESELDTRLITDLVVTQLKAIRHRRQVIIVTHNPNIVVNGDAELVIGLDIPHGEVVVDGAGGLQEDDIRSLICNVMEGGRDAFESRYSRIGERNSASR